MSDLIIDFRGMRQISDACLEAPPPSGTDPCSYTVPLRDSAEGAGSTARAVRFDRRGDSFVLSPSNSADLLTWAGSHANLTSVLTTLRVLHTITQSTRLGSSSGGAMTMSVLAHYITTGQGLDPNASEEEGQRIIISGLLDMLTDSAETALSALLGRLSILRGQDWLNAEARERVRAIMGLVDLVPTYRTFRQNFVEESEFTNWDSLTAERAAQVAAIAQFSRAVVLDNAFDRPLRYSDDFREAEAAYTSIYQAEISTGERPDFCGALETALRLLRGDRGLPRNFLDDCRLASRLVDRPATEAVHESIRRDLLSSAGVRRLQEGIEEESDAANMRVEWLIQQGDDASGGRIGEILEQVLLNVEYLPAPESEETASESGGSLSLDTAPFIVSLNTMIDAQSARRREFLLSALALMRRFFPESGDYPPVRVFVGGEFQEIEWQLSDENRQLLRQFLRSLESRLGISQDRSDLVLPLVEAGVCAVGAAGLLSSHLIPEVGENPDLQLGLGTASATLAGAGCTALIGHYLWPAITNDVHNQYVWDGVTALGGGVVAGGLYFLLSFLLRGEGTGPGIEMRFPIDPYGP